VVDGIFHRHVGGEDLLEAAGHLQVAVPVVGVQEIEVEGILGGLDQSLDGEVGLGDIEAAHIRFPNHGGCSTLDGRVRLTRTDRAALSF
jgi:hypothetical protein